MGEDRGGERGAPAEALEGRLKRLGGMLRDGLPREYSSLSTEIVEDVLVLLPEMPSEAPSFLADGNPNVELARSYLQALLRWDREAAAAQVFAALAAGVALRSLYLDVFAATQREVGRLWQLNEISVAQEHYCTAATQVAMSRVSGAIYGGKRRATMVATCPGNELHELGLRIVTDFFEMDGWHTIQLGSGTPARDVVESVAAAGAEVLMISVSLALNVPAAQDLITTLRADPRCRDVSVLVGGHPFNVDPALWRQVGADGCATDAPAAVALAARLREARP